MVSAPSYKPDIGEQRAFWNQHWGRREELKTLNDWALQRGERILGLIRGLPLKNPKILDMGCGFGWFTEQLSHCGEAMGVDLSDTAIAMAKEKYPHLTFVVENVLKDALPKNHFDVVVSQEVLAHCEDQEGYLKRVAEVLKPGGYFIVTTANKFVMHNLGDVGWKVHPPQHIETFVSAAQLKRMLKPHFRVLLATSMLMVGRGGPLRIVNSHKLNKILSLCLGMKLLRAIKERAKLGYSLLFVAQKRSI